ncbi:MAG: hypothetical protein Kow0089_17230 [Desulfobulbaceae bacterium]
MSLDDRDEKHPADTLFHHTILSIGTGTTPRLKLHHEKETTRVECSIPEPDNLDLLHYSLTFTARAIAFVEQSRGALLIHGGLARPPGKEAQGILLAGSSGAGKTTASRRLPSSWRSLSDDATLVMRDASGKYRAHPWPTWSRFFTGENTNSSPQTEEPTWDVRESLSLRAIFFLRHAAGICISPLDRTTGLTYLVETARQLSRPVTSMCSVTKNLDLEKRMLTTAEKIVSVIPCYSLALDRTGRFWEQIEEILPPTTPGRTGAARISPSEAGPDTPLIIRYDGPSMYPTLRPSDLLEIVSCANGTVQQGDIVCFSSPVDGKNVIHRVIEVSADGIRTRGDNNPGADPFIQQPYDLSGRVTALWRNGRKKTVPGGRRGMAAGYYARFHRSCRIFFSLLPNSFHRTRTVRSLPHLLTPSRFRPRIYAFRRRHLPPVLKLIAGSRVIGLYDPLAERWKIALPWRLLINRTSLPRLPDLSQPDHCG